MNGGDFFVSLLKEGVENRFEQSHNFLETFAE